jgi:hypothetical protein
MSNRTNSSASWETLSGCHPCSSKACLIRDSISLWTQLRHLSHIDCKQEAKSSVGKAAAGGVQGVSTAWAVNATSVTYFSLPTSRNLAGMPPSVNHLGEPQYADGLHRRLLGLGTSVHRKLAYSA